MSVIFYHKKEQQRLAIESKNLEETRSQGTIHTEIVPFAKFYPAEDYHQKFYLQGESALFKEFKAVYPNMTDLINSTAVARINGYAGGNGSQETFKKELNNYGLSDEGQKRLEIITDWSSDQSLYRNTNIIRKLLSIQDG